MNFYNINGVVIFTPKNLNANEIVVKTEDQGEKHVPVALINGNKLLIKVGENPHPMTLEHHIEYVLVETDKNVYVNYLDPTKPAEATFTLLDVEKVLAVYSYCNLHGVFVKKI